MESSIEQLAKENEKDSYLISEEFLSVWNGLSLTYKDIKEKPEDGCYIYGMYLEGCKWGYNTHQLEDSDPKKLFVDVPLILLLPMMDRQVPKTGIYMCPVYKVLSRSGTLSTTGHSTNYVMLMELPSI